MRVLSHCVLSVLLSIAGVTGALYPPAATQSAPAAQKDWIKRSNEYAQILLKIQAKYGPEFAGQAGVQG